MLPVAVVLAIVPIAYIAWSIWLIVLGLMLLVIASAPVTRALPAG